MSNQHHDLKSTSINIFKPTTSQLYNDQYPNDLLDLGIIYDLTKDEKIAKTLKESSQEIFLAQSNYAITLGRLFTDVYETLNAKDNNIELYYKWIELNHFSPEISQNYRRRYFLHKNTNLAGRNTVATLSQDTVNEILNSDNVDFYIKKLDHGSNEDEIKNLLSKKIVEEAGDGSKPMELIVAEFDLCEYDKFIKDLKEKFKTLTETEKKEAEKYLQKLHDLLKF